MSDSHQSRTWSKPGQTETDSQRRTQWARDGSGPVLTLDACLSGRQIIGPTADKMQTAAGSRCICTQWRLWAAQEHLLCHICKQKACVSLWMPHIWACLCPVRAGMWCCVMQPAGCQEEERQNNNRNMFIPFSAAAGGSLQAASWGVLYLFVNRYVEPVWLGRCHAPLAALHKNTVKTHRQQRQLLLRDSCPWRWIQLVCSSNYT